MIDESPTGEVSEESRSWFGRAWDNVAGAASEAGNMALLVREGAMDFVAGIPAIPGYIADLADMGAEALGADLYEGSAGQWIQGHARAGIDFLDPLKRAGIEARIETDTDRAIVAGTSLAGDVALTIFSMGAGAVKLAGTAGRVATIARTAEGANDMKLIGRLSQMLRGSGATVRTGADDAAGALTASADDIAAAGKGARQGKSWAEHANASSRTTLKDGFYATMMRGADILDDRVGFRTGWALRAPAYAVRYGLSALGVSFGTALAAHLYTDGGSSRALARGTNDAMDGLANMVQGVAPGFAEVLRDAGPEVAKAIVGLSVATFDMTRVYVSELATDRGLALDEQQLESMTYLLQGNSIQAALAAGGLDLVNGETLLTILENARTADNQQEYITAQLAETLGLAQEEVSAALQRSADGAYLAADEAAEAEATAEAPATGTQPQATLRERAGNAFTGVRDRAEEAADMALDASNGAFQQQIMGWLRQAPIIGTIIALFQWVSDLWNEHVAPLFNSAENGDLVVQGSGASLSAATPGAEVTAQSHDGGEPEQRRLAASDAEVGGPALAPA